MMTTVQNKEECGKGPKKTFAPPTQKSHFLVPCDPKAPKTENLGAKAAEAKARPRLPKSRLEMNVEKADTENGSGIGQEQKGKTPEKKQNKQAVKKEKGRSSLTNAEFEEIVQIVLQKSLQEYEGLACQESRGALDTSCAQSMVCTGSDKVPGSAAAATGNDAVDGEKMIVIHTAETSAPQEDKAVPAFRASKQGRPDPAPSEKKSNRPRLNKRKREAQDGKMESGQGRHEHRQKNETKKMIQDLSQISGQYLVWVQCSSSNCEKWRRLHGNIDPSVLPDNWSCAQNPDLKYNSCDIPEESWTGRDSEVAYAAYIPGSIIWAKQYGYPWWPGMVESDPDLGEYFLFASHLDLLPSKYHVTFFGETVSRAWIPVNMLKNFQELSLELTGMKKYRNKDFSQKLGAALIMAQQAEQISIQERVALFGFQSRYARSDSNGEGKDLKSFEANSPESCLQKEKEPQIEDKESQKDPTLPSSKQAKIRTKNPKRKGKKAKTKMGQIPQLTQGQGCDIGIANGRGETLPKKIMKKSLSGESAAPAPTVGREDQWDSHLDQPGPKKTFKTPQSKASGASLSEEEVSPVPESLAQQVPLGASPFLGTEGPRPQEPAAQETETLPSEDEVSSDLDLEQLLEDIGKESEEREELQHTDSEEEFVVIFEE